jgi:ankyrin repeat protein
MQRLLRQKDLDLCVRDGKGQTPLIVAATVLGHDNVKMLLGYGYRTNCGADMRSNDGNTALSHAVEAGDFNMVSLLASSWYVRDVKDKNGKPLYMKGNTGFLSLRNLDKLLLQEKYVFMHLPERMRHELEFN